MPRRTTQVAAAVRESTPRLFMMLATWFATVLGLVKSAVAVEGW